MAENTNAFSIAQAQFDHVAGLLGLEPNVREQLRWPRREFHFRIPVRMDDGTIRVFTASACSTTMPAAPPRAASASTLPKPWIPCAPWPSG